MERLTVFVLSIKGYMLWGWFVVVWTEGNVYGEPFHVCFSLWALSVQMPNPFCPSWRFLCPSFEIPSASFSCCCKLVVASFRVFILFRNHVWSSLELLLQASARPLSSSLYSHMACRRHTWGCILPILFLSRPCWCRYLVILVFFVQLWYRLYGQNLT